MIELTKEQIKTLENVFNWAANALEEEFDGNYIIIRPNKDNVWETLNLKTEEKKIVDLFKVMEKSICLKQPGKNRLDIAYIIKGKSGKDTLYYDVNGGWTTIAHCTKFYLKRDAKEVKGKIDNDWMRNIEIVRCKTEEM